MVYLNVCGCVYPNKSPDSGLGRLHVFAQVKKLVLRYPVYLVNTAQFFYDRVNHVKGHVAVEVSEDQTESSAVLPGFSYGDLDRTGNRVFLS